MRRLLALSILAFSATLSVVLAAHSPRDAAANDVELAIPMVLEYQEINQKYFGGKLPANTLIFWSRQLKAMNDMGQTISDGKRFTILLDIQMKEIGYDDVADEVLFHESCHIAVFPYDGHGAPFQKCMERLAKAGAFRDLW